jgi:hypothetical protein
MRKGVVAWGLGTVLLLGGASAHADGVRFGVQGHFGTGLGNGYRTEDGGDANLGGGVRVIWELGLEHEGLAFESSVDVFEKDSTFTVTDNLTGEPIKFGGRYWEFNLNATYTRGSKVKFYLGFGLNLAHDTVDRDFIVTGTDAEALDIGGNVLFGSRFFDHLFAESRIEVKGGGQAMVSVGILF